eukprot:TCONS_00027596-protein
MLSTNGSLHSQHPLSCVKEMFGDVSKQNFSCVQRNTSRDVILNGMNLVTCKMFLQLFAKDNLNKNTQTVKEKRRLSLNISFSAGQGNAMTDQSEILRKIK